MRLATEIIDRLNCFGSRMSKRNLERKMSAHKRPWWREAWELLVRTNCIQLTAGKRRQQIVTLTSIPKWSEPKPIIKRRKRKRRPTSWFKFLLPTFLSRDGYEGKAVEAEQALEQDM
jgi:hypothetical protein